MKFTCILKIIILSIGVCGFFIKPVLSSLGAKNRFLLLYKKVQERLAAKKESNQHFPYCNSSGIYQASNHYQSRHRSKNKNPAIVRNAALSDNEKIKNYRANLL